MGFNNKFSGLQKETETQHAQPAPTCSRDAAGDVRTMGFFVLLFIRRAAVIYLLGYLLVIYLLGIYLFI